MICGQFYSITLYFEKKNKKVHKVTFYDSLKIIPFSVEQIAKSFNLSLSKLEIDYKKERPKGHRLSLDERKYITNDVLIVAKALKVLFDEELQKMTQGSNALNDFKQILTKSKFFHYFPPLDYEVDKDLRKAYKGSATSLILFSAIISTPILYIVYLLLLITHYLLNNRPYF